MSAKKKIVTRHDPAKAKAKSMFLHEQAKVPINAAAAAVAEAAAVVLPEPVSLAVSGAYVFRDYQAPVFQDRSTGVMVLHWSRQIGKSFILAAWAVDRLITRPGRLVTVLSNSKENGAEFLRKCIEICHKNNTAFEDVDESLNLDFDAMRLELRIVAKGQTGRIKILAANSRTARGFSGDLILDEFGFHENSAEIWEAVEPILASNGDFLCRVASTGNGKHNVFYRMAAPGPDTVMEWEVVGERVEGVLVEAFGVGLQADEGKAPSSNIQAVLPHGHGGKAMAEVEDDLEAVEINTRNPDTLKGGQHAGSGSEVGSGVGTTRSGLRELLRVTDPRSGSALPRQGVGRADALGSSGPSPDTRWRGFGDGDGSESHPHQNGRKLPRGGIGLCYSGNGFVLSRVPRSLAWHLGLKIYDAQSRTEVRPEAARAAALDKAAYDQNYECSFADENLTLLSHELINAAERMGIGEIAERDWTPKQLEILRAAMGPLYVGFDVARKADLSVITVLEKVGEIFLARAILRIQDMRLPEQQDRLGEICRLPKFLRAAIDMTGLGLGLFEYAQKEFGAGRIHGINFATSVPATRVIEAEGRKREMVRVTEALAMEVLQAYEDRRIQQPVDGRLRDDLRKPERVTTPGGRVSIAATRDEAGHADHFWSLALALEAASGGSGVFAFEKVELKRGRGRVGGLV